MPHANPHLSMAEMGLPSKASVNPIAEGDDGLRTLREHAECDIPAASKKLNEHVQLLLNTEGEHPTVELALGQGIFTGLRMAQHCKTHVHARTAVNFKSDEKLTEMTEQIKEAEIKGIALQEEMKMLMVSTQKLLSERWNYSVKAFGLNIETNFYRIDEDKDIIEELELRCDNCTAGKDINEACLSVGEYFSTIKGEEA